MSWMYFSARMACVNHLTTCSCEKDLPDCLIFLMRSDKSPPSQ